MNLKDQALAEYEREKRESEAADKERALTLARFATQKFQSQFQVSDPLTFQPVSETHALLKIAEDVQVEARAEYDAIEFYAIVPCQRCEDIGRKRIATLADLGEAIRNGASCSCTEPPFGSVPCVLEERTDVLPDILEALKEHNGHLSTIRCHLDDLLTVLQKATTVGGSIKVFGK